MLKYYSRVVSYMGTNIAQRSRNERGGTTCSAKKLSTIKDGTCTAGIIRLVTMVLTLQFSLLNTTMGLSP